MSTLLKIMGIAILACLGLLFLGHLFIQHNSDTTLSQVILRHDWVFVSLRYGMYVSCILFWPYCIKLVGIWRRWQPETIIYLSSQRLKLLSFFVIIEVFFVYNLLGHLS